MSDVPIGEHVFLSDCASAALVTSDGSVDWWCTPRFDSAPVFTRLLDPSGGHFSIRPSDARAERSVDYRGPSLVADTTWTSNTGILVVSDALALGPRERGHDLGLSSPGVLLRHVRCLARTMRIRVEYAPRPEAGLIRPRMRTRSGCVVAEAGAQTLTLSTDAALRVNDATATADIEMSAGHRLAFALEISDAWAPPPEPWSARRIRRRLQKAHASWESWSALHQSYDGPLRELVLRSGIVLRGLTYARSGAMVAAPTTSLPEGLGSGRNWDYRYTWVRDASMTMQGLFVAACPDEAARFFAYLARAAATQLDEGLDLQIMFGVAGERDLSERLLPHLEGWRGSGPVRVGNGAWDQRQLDVYGALLDAAYTLRHHIADLEPETRAFLIAAVDAAATRWDERDQGIWEFRGPARHFVHSKLMCWVALDRGLGLVDLLEPPPGAITRWHEARRGVRSAILDNGWNDAVGAFTQSFGSATLDASVLMLAIVEFLPGDDPRLRSTIDAVERGLTDERGLLRRYVADDGLETTEGSFLLCTFWLAHALAATGQTRRAEVVLDRAAAYATHLGLFAEEVDTETGDLLGNYPQAFSHIGLVTAADAIQRARSRLRVVGQDA